MSGDVGRGSGAGKLILFGEHAVVYGTPAIVAGLSRGCTAEVRPAGGSSGPEAGLELRRVIEADEEPSSIGNPTTLKAFRAIRDTFPELEGADIAARVDVHIPIGVGLGSSASMSAALGRAFGDLTDREDLVADAVSAGEEVFHGNPSGIDQLAAMEGGLHFFRRTEGPAGPGMETAPLDTPSFRVAICVAGPASSTAAMVDGVAGLREREPDLFEHLELLIGDITRKASKALQDGDLERVGELMDINHGALVSLGVSTDELDQACYIARRAGAVGAKLTGAGGGGCVFALLPENGGHGVVDTWREAGLEAFEVTIGQD